MQTKTTLVIASILWLLVSPIIAQEQAAQEEEDSQFIPGEVVFDTGAGTFLLRGTPGSTSAKEVEGITMGPRPGRLPQVVHPGHRGVGIMPDSPCSELVSKYDKLVAELKKRISKLEIDLETLRTQGDAKQDD